MKIEPATAADVRHVALHMRERDFDEFRGISRFDSRVELSECLAGIYGGRSDILCGSLDGVPICIGGSIEAWPNVVSLLLLATDDFPKIGRQITKFVRNELFPRYFGSGVHRIQAVSLDGYSQIHEWLNLIGLRREGPPMRGFGKNGEDYVMFAKVKHVRPLGA